MVPPDHLVRQIDAVLDLDWVHKELAPYYSYTGRPSIDPVLMIRMLIVGYVFALRSERRLCAEVRVIEAAQFLKDRNLKNEVTVRDVRDNSVAVVVSDMVQHLQPSVGQTPLRD